MFDLLKGLRVVEGASFIAAPYAGLSLLRLGAEVIRFDQIGGGPDFNRWPRSPKGPSLYWEGLNKGKKSVAIDLGRREGRELAVRLATAPGGNAGVFLTNYPQDGFLSHARLVEARADMITVRVTGWGDGAAAMDYTVNAGIGVPLMTGPASMGEVPINHMLPAWDLLTGAQAAYALLAAERIRRETGQGQEVRIALGDIAMTAMGDLGEIAQVAATGQDRARYGNDLYGAFGRDFLTRDGQRIMLVAITARQWSGLVKALQLEEPVARLEAELGLSFARDEGLRFQHRDRLFPLVEAEVAKRDLAEVAAVLERHDALWQPYRTLKQALAADRRFSAENPAFAVVEHPSGHRYLTPGSPLAFGAVERQPPPRAPRLGEHTDQVLAEVLRLPGHEIARLHDQGVVAGPAA